MDYEREDFIVMWGERAVLLVCLLALIVLVVAK